MDELDIITRDGARLKGESARAYLGRQRAAADAILLERAQKVMQRRFRIEILTDATVHAVFKVMDGLAGSLRKQAEAPEEEPAGETFPFVPSGQIDAEVVADMRRLFGQPGA